MSKSKQQITEERLNRLLKKVKSLHLKDEELRRINNNIYFYSIGILNELQAVAAMVCILKSHRIKTNKIIQLLGEEK